MPQGSESIEVDYILEHPPEQVWRLLTERELLEKWLMPNDITSEVGHRFNFRTKPMGDWDGVVYCEVLESSPFTRFVYSWKGGSGENVNYGHQLDTVVTWTLAPTSEGGTVLHLSHYGFNADDYAFKIMGGGWRQMNAGNVFSRLLNGELVAARECDR